MLPKGSDIVGLGAVCSLGLGAGRMFSAWQEGRSGLRKMLRFDSARYQTAYAGEAFPDLPDGREPTALSLGALALAEAWSQAQAAGVPAAKLRKALLVLASTKAHVVPLENYIRKSEISVEQFYTPLAVARQLAADFGISGPVQAVSLACASGAAALALAAGLLAAGEVETAVVVGAEALSDFLLTGFSSLKSLAPEPCRPFDRDRRGLTLGEAGAALILTAAGQEQARPLARLAGWGLASDAMHLTAPDREGRGLAAAMESALKHAGWKPESVDYVNAHGTGTVYNDAMEAKAMARVFGLPGPPLSALKGNCGHTLGAAGVLEAAATCLALEHAWAPATWGLEHPGVEESLDLIMGKGRPLPERPRALSLSAGFGGFNAVLALEGVAA